MLALEVGETGWLLGFASGFGQKPLRRKVASRDRVSLVRQVAWARDRLGLSDEARVVSCYEAGRDGFWPHRFLESEGFESLVEDSSSIEVNRKKPGGGAPESGAVLLWAAKERSFDMPAICAFCEIADWTRARQSCVPRQ